MKSTIQNKQKSNAELYFKKFDKCKFDNDYYNLFTKDVEIYFPKFGFIYGKEDIRKFTGIMLGF